MEEIRLSEWRLVFLSVGFKINLRFYVWGKFIVFFCFLRIGYSRYWWGN